MAHFFKKIHSKVNGNDDNLVGAHLNYGPRKESKRRDQRQADARDEHRLCDDHPVAVTPRGLDEVTADNFGVEDAAELALAVRTIETEEQAIASVSRQVSDIVI